MLYLPAGQPEPVRIHGAYISTEETEGIVAAIKAQGVPPSTVELTPKAEEMSFDERERDSLYEEALKLVVVHQQASASLLQRRLKVGYSRAGRLIDELEMTGIIGPFDGSKARQVLVDEAYLEEMYGKVEEK
jgi:S-DNA-T family DNA segregation ATPase FtsK/SpoIIIE